jgi:hypothetical protein
MGAIARPVVQVQPVIRLDGKPVQALERGDVPVEAMTDQQLMSIIRGGSCERVAEPKQLIGPPPVAK